jgi:predicted GNAT family acetyltransferase
MSEIGAARAPGRPWQGMTPARCRLRTSSMVTDDAAKQRFELEVPGGVAFATYRRAPGVVTILHTEVPQALSGKGLGSELAKGLLDLIRARGEKVIPRCKFIAAFIGKHAEYQELVE